MELSAIVTFWREMKAEIHPADESTLRNYANLFNLDNPPPAFIGDVLRAPIIILMANGGYNAVRTGEEFNFPGAADGYRHRLHEPRPSETRFTSPYYQRGELWRRLTRGNVCVINAIAYRSKKVTEGVVLMARSLPSARFHRDWLTQAVAPLAAAHKRAVIVKRGRLWGLEYGNPGLLGFFSANPLHRYVSRVDWARADEWLNSE